MVRFAVLVTSLLAFFATASALKFELESSPAGNQRCIREFVASETLVVVKVKSNGRATDGQRLAMTITDNHDNRYAYKDNIIDRAHQLFSPSPDTSFDICFTNTLVQAKGSQRKTRDIEIDVEIGTDARDWNALQAAEKLKPTELTLRQINDKVDELYNDLEYMRVREERLRDTNESTNRRVKNFFLLIMLSFIGLGAWQIYYLRSYFRSKHII